MLYVSHGGKCVDDVLHHDPVTKVSDKHTTFMYKATLKMEAV
jgi:hypothetical protein